MIVITMVAAVAFVPIIMVTVALITGDWDFFDNHPARRGRQSGRNGR